MLTILIVIIVYKSALDPEELLSTLHTKGRMKTYIFFLGDAYSCIPPKSPWQKAQDLTCFPNMICGSLYIFRSGGCCSLIVKEQSSTLPLLDG